MAKGRKTYPRVYRERPVEMYRAGRSAESLAKDFEPTAQSIRNWVRQADLDEGRRQVSRAGQRTTVWVGSTDHTSRWRRFAVMA